MRPQCYLGALIRRFPGAIDTTNKQVDIFPTLMEAASQGQRTLPSCPDGMEDSRDTSLCTEGFSMLPLLNKTSSTHAPVPNLAAMVPGDGGLPRAWAFSQCVRHYFCRNLAVAINTVLRCHRTQQTAGSSGATN